MRTALKSIGIIILLFSPTFIYAQEDVTLTVQGQGANKEEAKLSAFRNAVEQAFGTFVSSNTQILNDELIKDEIVSVSNGNIKSFNIISETSLPNNEYVITMNATVSIQKLTSFVESKGFETEFKGATFSNNIKLQILNETSESKAVTNICKVLYEIQDKCFDFIVKINGEPISNGGGSDSWKIPISISVQTNSNLLLVSNYARESLLGLSMTKKEVENYESLNKTVYPLVLFDSKVHDCSKKIYTAYNPQTNTGRNYGKYYSASSNTDKTKLKRTYAGTIIDVSCDNYQPFGKPSIVYFRNKASRDKVIALFKNFEQTISNFKLQRQLQKEKENFTLRSIYNKEVSTLFPTQGICKLHNGSAGYGVKDCGRGIVHHYSTPGRFSIEKLKLEPRNTEFIVLTNFTSGVEVLFIEGYDILPLSKTNQLTGYLIN